MCLICAGTCVLSPPPPQAGVGRFQWVLLFVTGLALAADTVELFVVSYVIPSAEVEFCLTSAMKSWLGKLTAVF